ncbi:MAG: hypothetical protein E7191_04365 [Erysipelotrichaceae bacterium]|nr:hypothetical protein [Erysipelotrichaceae bacterium]
MTNKELKEYLTAIVDLEQNYYLQTKLITKLEDRLQNGSRHIYLGSRPIILEYTPKAFHFDVGGSITLSAIVGVFVGAILAIILGNVLIATGHKDIYYDIGIGKLWGISVIVSVVLIFALLYVICKSGHIDSEKRALAAAKSKLEEAQETYDADKKHAEEHNAKVTLQKKFYQRELDSVRKMRGETKAWLTVLYAKNIIYPKYQNYVATSTILDYLLSGRCSQLEGHEGAYNLYENESRLNAIITKLEDIERAVNRVAGNQYLLAKSIENSNRRMENLFQSTCELAERMSSLESGMSAISDNLEQINELSAITAYNTERTAAEVRYRNIIDNVYTAL